MLTLSGTEWAYIIKTLVLGRPGLMLVKGHVPHNSVKYLPPDSSGRNLVSIRQMETETVMSAFFQSQEQKCNSIGTVPVNATTNLSEHRNTSAVTASSLLC